MDLSAYPHSLPADFGPYHLEKRLGEGGMGSVFLAVDRDSLRHGARVEFAVKVPLAFLLRKDPTLAESMLREARAALKVRHKNVVAVHKVGKVGDIPYLAMERLHGRPVDELLTSGPLPPHEVLRIGREVALGLAVVHSKGLVHRDIKPSNIFCTDDEQVKLLDLGIAKAVDAQTRLTGTGLSKGTPGYLAPEQLKPGAKLDGQTDLFALGAVLVELALGEPVFFGDDLFQLFKQVEHPEAHVDRHQLDSRVDSSVPGLGALVKALLREAPGNRPLDAVVVAQQLAALMGSPVSSAEALRFPLTDPLEAGAAHEGSASVPPTVALVEATVPMLGTEPMPALVFGDVKSPRFAWSIRRLLLLTGVGAVILLTSICCLTSAGTPLTGWLGQKDEGTTPYAGVAAESGEGQAESMVADAGSAASSNRSKKSRVVPIQPAVTTSPTMTPPVQQDLDADRDGIDLPEDRCPRQPETKNGYQDADGCPDSRPAPAPEKPSLATPVAPLLEDRPTASQVEPLIVGNDRLHACFVDFDPPGYEVVRAKGTIKPSGTVECCQFVSMCSTSGMKVCRTMSATDAVRKCVETELEAIRFPRTQLGDVLDYEFSLR